MSAISLVPADSGGCGFYRIIQPAEKYALETGKVISLIKPGSRLPGFPEWRGADSRFGFDFVLTARQSEDHQVSYWRWFKSQFPHIPIYMDWDDLLWNPDPRSSYRPTPRNIENLDTVARMADRLICSTQPMQDALWRRYKKRARIVPNMVSEDDFKDIILRDDNERLRIFWGGSATHQADLEQIIPAVLETHDKYDWHFMGYVPNEIKPFVQYHDGVSREDYLPILSSLRPHICIAPLVDIPFNKCKSNVKLLEYGSIGAATISSKVHPYNLAPSEKIILGSASEWVASLKKMESEPFRLRNAEKSQEYSRSFSIERGGGVICNAYK